MLDIKTTKLPINAPKHTVTHPALKAAAGMPSPTPPKKSKIPGKNSASSPEQAIKGKKVALCGKKSGAIGVGTHLTP
jgi:hypothetical protein